MLVAEFSCEPKVMFLTRFVTTPLVSIDGLSSFRKDHKRDSEGTYFPQARISVPRLDLQLSNGLGIDDLDVLYKLSISFFIESQDILPTKIVKR